MWCPVKFLVSQAEGTGRIVILMSRYTVVHSCTQSAIWREFATQNLVTQVIQCCFELNQRFMNF